MKPWLAVPGYLLAACIVTLAPDCIAAWRAAETGDIAKFGYRSNALPSSSDQRDLLRPYGLDIGHTVVLRGWFRCPLYADLCVVVAGASRLPGEERRVKVSLATVSPERRSYLMELCAEQADRCRNTTVAGRVIRGINGPIVMADEIRVGGMQLERRPR